MKRRSFLTLFAGLPFFGAGAASAKYASGGIASSELMASYVGELHVGEAIIPLTNGKTISIAVPPGRPQTINVPRLVDFINPRDCVNTERSDWHRNVDEFIGFGNEEAA
jgi:hypothetical protein